MIRDEGGQTAIAMVFVFLAIFVAMALALDAGLWYFDHRSAQGQAESAALAAALELPALVPTTAFDKANEWLTHNGIDAADLPVAPTLSLDELLLCDNMGSDEIRIVFAITFPGGVQYDSVRVCIRRPSLVLLSGLSNVASVKISAAATARAGGAEGATVMPWSLIPFDKQCDAIGEMCVVDVNGNGQKDPGEYVDSNLNGVYDPGEPGQCTFLSCPFGLDPNRLIRLKADNNANCDTNACPTIAIEACGNGASQYGNCIEGTGTSSGFVVGATVTVDTKSGNMGTNSKSALDALATANGDAAQTCDISSTPNPLLGGLDTDVVGGALATKRNDPACDYRKVLMAIVCSQTPATGTGCVPRNGTNTLDVIGLAVYYVAAWKPSSGGTNEFGNTTQACSVASSGGSNFNCGVVWGYLLEGEDPATRFKLDKIGGSPNPLAPILVALVE